MERSKEKVELIHNAIQQLIEEEEKKKKNREVSSGESFVSDDNDPLILSRLLSQIESLKGDGAEKQPDEPSEESPYPAAGGEVEKKSETAVKIGAEEIMKELREVKRQNSITHWLLSVMIALTVAWQLSEFTLVLKVKNGLSNPFRSFGGLLAGMLKGPATNGNEEERESSSTKQQHLIEVPQLPLKIPELPDIDLPKLGFDGEE